MGIVRAGANGAPAQPGPEYLLVRTSDGASTSGRYVWDANHGPTHAFDSLSVGAELDAHPGGVGINGVTWRVGAARALQNPGIRYGTIRQICVLASVANITFFFRWQQINVVFRRAGAQLLNYDVPPKCLPVVPDGVLPAAPRPAGGGRPARQGLGPLAGLPVPQISQAAIIDCPAGTDEVIVTGTFRFGQQDALSGGAAHYNPPVNDQAFGWVAVSTDDCKNSPSSSSSSSRPSSSSSSSSTRPVPTTSSSSGSVP